MRHLKLSKYFETNDGSLPEIEISFADTMVMPLAFKHLYDRGAQNVTSGGGSVWIYESEKEIPFSGPEDATLVDSGAATPFHVVLSHITGFHCQIPDLGVFVCKDCLVLDYRMGTDWGLREINSFLELLKELQGFGGEISVPWWGSDGENDFLTELQKMR